MRPSAYLPPFIEPKTVDCVEKVENLKAGHFCQTGIFIESNTASVISEMFLGSPRGIWKGNSDSLWLINRNADSEYASKRGAPLHNFVLHGSLTNFSQSADLIPGNFITLLTQKQSYLAS